MRKSILIVGILILLAAGVGFYSFQSGAPSVESSQTVKLGAALALTGDAAAWGEAEKNGITLAVEELNRLTDQPNVEIVFEDTRSLSADTVLATAKLINVNRVQAIIGPTWMDSYAGAAPLSDDHKTVIVTPSGAASAIKADKPYPYVFSTWYDADTNAQALADFVAKDGHARIAIVYEQDPYWQDIAMRVQTSAQAKKLDVVSMEEVPRGESDFRTLIAKLKGQSLDAVVFGFLSEEQVLAFLKQRAELGLTIPLYSNESVADYLQADSFRGLTDGVGSVAPVVENQAFVARYRERFGKDPAFSASNAYDATRMLVQGLKGGASSGDLVTALQAQTFETTTFGRVRFEENGAIKKGEFVLNVMKDGQLTQKR